MFNNYVGSSAQAIATCSVVPSAACACTLSLVRSHNWFDDVFVLPFVSFLSRVLSHGEVHTMPRLHSWSDFRFFLFASSFSLH